MPRDDDKAPDLLDIEDMHEITVRISVPRPAEAQKKVVPTIRVVAGPDMLSYVTIPTATEIVIGRDEMAALPLTDITVSKRHAKVENDDGGTLVLTDLDSTNGTAVNGQPVTRTILRPGDHLEIGAVSMRVDMLSSSELGHLRRVVSRLESANRDPMTGLLTRSFMNDTLPGLMERCDRAEAPISCVFVDIDRFKSINDQHGHKIGDEVIRGISRLMMLGVRDNDPAIRYGGDEIVLILPGSKESLAVEVAERIRRMIAGHDWDRTAPGLRVTCSFGVAERVREETVTDWFDRTDKATYASKRNGRNQVSAFSRIDA